MKVRKKKPAPEPSPERDPRTGWILALIVFAAIAVYLNSIGGEFVYDDKDLILENSLIRSPRHIPRIFGFPEGKALQRPVRHLSYLIDFQVSGLKPWGYHVFNILYHALASLLVFFIVRLLLGRRRTIPAGVAALLFALHPIHTEAVAYISGRRDVLSALFYFLGVLFFCRFRSGKSAGWFPAALVVYVLAYFSKEMAITLPAMFVLIDWAGEVREGSFRDVFPALGRVLRRFWRQYLIFFLAAVIFLIYTVFIQAPSYQEEYYGESPVFTFLTVARVFAYYVYLLFFPLTLSADYTYNSFPVTESYGDPAAWLAVFFIVFLVGASVWALGKSRWMGFAGLWFFIALLPVSHIFPHHILMAEHFLYLPSFAFCLFAGIVFERALKGNRTKIAAWVFLILIVLAYSARTIVRNRDWKDPLTLWQKTAETFPENAQARGSLGLEYFQKSRFDLAIRELEAAARIKPEKPFVYFNLGYAYRAKGHHDDANRAHRRAIEGYERILGDHPALYKARINLGILYSEYGRLDEAIRQYREAITIEPGNARGYYNLGYVYTQKGLPGEAVAAYEKGLSIDPFDPDAHNNLGALYGQMGRSEEAIAEFEAVVRLDPGRIRAYYNLGYAYFHGGRCRQGIAMWQKAVRVDGNLKRAQYYSSLLAEKRAACP